ncbi:MFS general substrate transporter [Lentithecium fluviatile CBS 122367]|uniref:MFS general substrate transporter n=1 Tax=Lentithecium fluviatile CBS 122367 TaxID=1168545 RepID=A0A6G1JJ89_9PLEO|nr:MFS general substrate transporter [Lentithecium fluviatile CBS 122367]
MDDLTGRDSTAKDSTASTAKDGTRTREVIAEAGGAEGSGGAQRDGFGGRRAGDGEVAESGEVVDSRETAHPRRRWLAGRKHRRSYSHTHFRVYKRRWFGLAQLVLLNIVVSWDWLTFAPVSTSSAEYFGVSETAINWLSTAFMFAFVTITPVTIWTLNRSPKESIIVSSVLLLLGNWIRYAGTKAQGGVYGVVMFGQILTGLAQPFVLAAPTRYSDLWFTETGRVSATALASLANPFGGALAQLINPFLGSVPNIVLYVAIISTVASIPSIFIPAAPPTPPCASASVSKEPLLPSVRHIIRSPPFYVIALTFAVYVGFFNAFSSLINQILYPYGYSEDEAGICGAVLIIVGLVTAAIMSPIFDRTHAYLGGIKVLCVLVAVSYLGFIWAPQTRGIPAPYVLAAILGASSFSLLPIALEYLVEITFPASPAVSSTIIWAGGQLLGGIFIVIMTALKDGRDVDLTRVREDGRGNGGGDRPPGNMYRALVFEGAVALAVLPFPLALGVKRFGLAHGEGRLKVDEHREGAGSGSGEGDGEEVL